MPVLSCCAFDLPMVVARDVTPLRAAKSVILRIELFMMIGTLCLAVCAAETDQ